MAMGTGGDMGHDGMGGMMPTPNMSPMPNGGGDMDHDMGGSMGMHMTFFWGKRVEILFSGWPGDRGVGMYVLALLFVFVAAALIDCLSSISQRLLSRGPAATAGDRRVSTALLLTALHAVGLGLAYLVMLAVMSFNVGVFIVAIAGHTAGFLATGCGVFKRVPSDEPEAARKPMHS